MEALGKLYGDNMSVMEIVEEKLEAENFTKTLTQKSDFEVVLVLVCMAVAEFFVRLAEFIFTLVSAIPLLIYDGFKQLVKKDVNFEDSLGGLGARILIQLPSIFVAPVDTLKSFGEIKAYRGRLEVEAMRKEARIKAIK